MTDPDREGRLKITQRILKEWPEEWETIVSAGAGETGAQVQERAAQRAMELYWQRSNHREHERVLP